MADVKRETVDRVTRDLVEGARRSGKEISVDVAKREAVKAAEKLNSLRKDGKR